MTALDMGPAAHILRAGHWRHEWVPLDFEAAKSHYHQHVPKGWYPPTQDRPDRLSGENVSR